LGLPGRWKANKGISPQDFVGLAQAEGLRIFNFPTGNFTDRQLEHALQTVGRLWCAGQWDGVGHIVVLTGIDGNRVYINDPNPACR
jgi:cysteine protease avirulence protein AvrRpt2